MEEPCQIPAGVGSRSQPPAALTLTRFARAVNDTARRSVTATPRERAHDCTVTSLI